MAWIYWQNGKEKPCCCMLLLNLSVYLWCETPVVIGEHFKTM